MQRLNVDIEESEMETHMTHKYRTRLRLVAVIAAVLAVSLLAYTAAADNTPSNGGTVQDSPIPVEPDGGIGDTPIPVEPDGGIGDGAGPVGSES